VNIHHKTQPVNCGKINIFQCSEFRVKWIFALSEQDAEVLKLKHVFYAAESVTEGINCILQ
jgi:hypothetical protein